MMPTAVSAEKSTGNLRSKTNYPGELYTKKHKIQQIQRTTQSCTKICAACVIGLSALLGASENL
ncbi:hypothetical protein OKW30_002848 [Paraburkholderia sp. Clong3]|nr:hypothetical protein [Paraburkholderia sp. CI2]